MRLTVTQIDVMIEARAGEAWFDNTGDRPIDMIRNWSYLDNSWKIITVEPAYYELSGAGAHPAAAEGPPVGGEEHAVLLWRFTTRGARSKI